jgi:GNAT superfamily N-acetyltransferase
MSVDLSQYSLFRLTPEYKIKDFNCNDTDLNEYFHQDAINYTNQLMAVTYVLENKDKTIGFFSVANDKIQIIDNKSVWNRLNRKVSNEKRRTSYPAVKVGRLGIDEKFQGKGVGTMLIRFIKEFFLLGNKTGCRFITVDAYNNPQTIEFYKKNGFDFFLTDDSREKTRLMFYDLILLKNATDNLASK